MKTTTNKPSKGYGTIQTEVMTNPDISYGAKALYSYYCSVQGGKDKSWKSNSTIMKEFGVSKNFFYKIKNELIELGLITSTQRFNTSPEVSVHYLEVSTSRRDSSSTLKGDSNSNSININITNTADAVTSELDKPIALSSPTSGTLLTKAEQFGKDFKLTEAETTLYEALKLATKNKGVRVDNWYVDSQDKARLMNLTQSHLSTEELLETISRLESRNSLQFVGVALLHKEVYGDMKVNYDRKTNKLTF